MAPVRVAGIGSQGEAIRCISGGFSEERASRLVDNILGYISAYDDLERDMDDVMCRLDAVQTDLHRLLLENGITPPVDRFFWEENPYLNPVGPVGPSRSAYNPRLTRQSPQMAFISRSPLRVSG
ncbi:hypothetical protein FOJ82_11155 [Tessaracoccus rhinocerotis]|uniref:Uncharacterized protein n=1 Tax=Tessaracoccus rhinocerotis TaxID=1689449 RepID=A0A553JZC4_9ACTN|nr:hypothetical protein [Tessaracoccus rhinocerotis]TRY17818.1 hypothetical protein FOJ82_11155 [Tessaracoccus rhinocerotis]